jgi:hypothetical protein
MIELSVHTDEYVNDILGKKEFKKKRVVLLNQPYE